jgi:hypothetical protein
MNFKQILHKSVRDNKTIKRIETAQKTSFILGCFFEKGFRNFESLYAIVYNFFPEIPKNRLWNVWHFRQIDELILEKLEVVFKKLKNE